MSHKNSKQTNRNYMKELRELICRIKSVQLEPEICNVSCPPLGCPRGLCPGMCCDERGIPDPCCLSKMPADNCTTSSLRSTTPRCSRDDCCHYFLQH